MAIRSSQQCLGDRGNAQGPKVSGSPESDGPVNLYDHGGTLLEFTTLSPSYTDDWIVECTEMSDPAGFVGSRTVSPDSAGCNVRFDEARTVPLDVMRYWLTLLPPPRSELACDVGGG